LVEQEHYSDRSSKGFAVDVAQCARELHYGGNNAIGASRALGHKWQCAAHQQKTNRQTNIGAGHKILLVFHESGFEIHDTLLSVKALDLLEKPTQPGWKGGV
jgi:hypothetical protein